MTEFREDEGNDPIADPIWNALQTTHRLLGLHGGLACKYRADVAPFAALAENSAAAYEDLRSLLTPGESAYLLAEKPPDISGLTMRGPMGVLQMLFAADKPIPEQGPGAEVRRITCDDSAAMVALTDAAFPGFFRTRTCDMGDYYGVWQEDRLVAMGGERFVFEPYREISGVCTLPEFRGQGLAARILWQILRDHRRDGRVSWLHVTSTNSNAIALYERLGFVTLREVPLYQLTKLEPLTA